MSFLLWRGMLEKRDIEQRLMVVSALTLLSVSLIIMQQAFVGINQPDTTTFAVVLLLPIMLGAQLLGTLAGGALGLFAGSLLWAHALYMPLGYLEVFFVTPWTSIVLLTLCGLLQGTLLSFAYRRQLPLMLRLAWIALTCTVVSWVCSFALPIGASPTMLSNVLREHTTGTSIVLDSDTLTEGIKRFRMDIQAWMDAGLSTLLCITADYAVRKLSALSEGAGVRSLFRISISVVTLFAFLLTITASYYTVTEDELGRAEASIRSEVNYLCLQLESMDNRSRSFLELAGSSGVDPAELSESELETYRTLSDPIGEIISGYTMAETGTVALLSNGAILATDDPRLPLGSDIETLLGSDVSIAIEESLRTGELRRVLYNGVLAMPVEGESTTTGLQVAYLMAGRYGSLTVMIIEPSSMVFRNRRAILGREITISAVLLTLVFMLINLLLSLLVASRIDKTNAALKRITEGELDVRAEVSGTKEFQALAIGINQTVDALQGWIAEAKSRMDSELAAAREIQESALPHVFPAFPEIEAFDVYASMDPAREVGGDFYDFFLIADDSDAHKSLLGFLVADVSGKGIPASLFMMRAKALIRENMEKGMDLAEVIASANHQLCDGNDVDMFVTAWVGVLDYATGHLQFVNAGHNPPLFLHDGSWEWLRKRSGLPLGFFDDVTYRTFSMDCSPGDMFLVYSDGVTEAFDISEEQYGEQRLEAVATAHGQDCAQELLEAVRSDLAAYVGEAEQSDDITIMTLKLC